MNTLIINEVVHWITGRKIPFFLAFITIAINQMHYYLFGICLLCWAVNSMRAGPGLSCSVFHCMTLPSPQCGGILTSDNIEMMGDG